MQCRALETVRLRYPADPGDDALYPLAIVELGANNAEVAELELELDEDGRYSVAFTPTAPGHYVATLRVYEDEEHEIPSDVYGSHQIEIDVRGARPMEITGKIVSREASKDAASQWAGTEFLLTETRDAIVHRFFSLELELGAEAKDLTLNLVTAGGATIKLWEALDDTATSKRLTQEDVDVILQAGDELKLISANATAAMKGKLTFDRTPRGKGSF